MNDARLSIAFLGDGPRSEPNAICGIPSIVIRATRMRDAKDRDEKAITFGAVNRIPVGSMMLLSRLHAGAPDLA